VGSGENISIKEFVTLLKDLSGNNKTFLNFGGLPYRANEIMKCSPKIESIKKLGWISKYSIHEGLKKMVEIEKKGK
jgi:nucleoside-diphosphate-sugar epimerase